MSQGRILAWAGSAGLHLAAGAVLLLALPEQAPEAVPVLLLETPAAETIALPQVDAGLASVPEPQAEATPKPPAPEPPSPEPPPEPSSPEPRTAEPPPPPVPPEPPPEDISADLPRPPPSPPREPPPRPALPRHPAPPRAAAPAPQIAKPHPAPPAAAAPVPAASAVPSASYVAQLLGALERQKRYPQEARWRRAQGVALLRFRMRRDGTVIGSRIERSAGDPALDEAVLAMIQRASPLPAPPSDMPGEVIELTVPVRFALR